jgi:photosystem II stability/assembly factor-like uncharacterized protein
MGVIIKNSAGATGEEHWRIMNSGVGGTLKLFPAQTQVVLLSKTKPSQAGIDTFKSYDSGDSYEDRLPLFPALGVWNTAVSFNNRYYHIGDPSKGGGEIGYIATSMDFGATFSYDVSNLVNDRAFSKIAASRDGKYVLGGCGGYQIDGEALLSQDFGANWSRPFATNEWYKAFVDISGMNMLMGGNGFNNALTTQYSDDYGATWNDFGEDLTTLGDAMISGDGNYKVVWEQYEQSGQKARVYISTDWATWTQHNLTKRFSGGSISNDGKYILIPPSDGFTTGGVNQNLSSDYGVTFDSIPLEYISSEMKWSDSAMSSDGKFMIVIPGFNESGGGRAYKSVNFGVTWTRIATSDIPQGNYSAVRMSKSGRYVYVVGANEGIIHSTNYMATWTQQFDGSTGNGVFINF